MGTVRPLEVDAQAAEPPPADYDRQQRERQNCISYIQARRSCPGRSGQFMTAEVAGISFLGDP